MRRLWATSTGAFSAPQFPILWGASALFSFAQWMERIAVGWLVLDETGSVFLTALSWAVRSAPGVVAGPLAGVVADRYPRPAVLATGSLAKAAAIFFTGSSCCRANRPSP